MSDEILSKKAQAGDEDDVEARAGKRRCGFMARRA